MRVLTWLPSAYKRVTAFLKKVPEYNALEKNVPAQELVTRLELANILFNHVEQVFSSYLSTHNGDSSRDAETGQESERTSSLRHRKAIIVAKSQNGVTVPAVALHELILERAHRLGCLPPAVARLRRQMQHGRSRTPTVNVLLDLAAPKLSPTPGQVNVSLPIAYRSEGSVFVVLAEFLQLIFQYHRSKQIGLDIQFYVRFQKYLTYVITNVRTRLENAAEAQRHIASDTLYRAAQRSLVCRLPIASQKSWRAAMGPIFGYDAAPGAIRSVNRTTYAISGMIRLKDLWDRRGTVTYLVDPWCFASSELSEFASKSDCHVLSATVPNFEAEFSNQGSLQKNVVIRDVETPEHLRIIDRLSRMACRTDCLPCVLVHVPAELDPVVNSIANVIDLTPDQETVKDFIFDHTLLTEQPEFHTEKMKHKSVLSELEAGTYSRADRILSRLCKSVVGEDFMLDVIQLGRQYRAVNQQRQLLDSFAAEIAPAYEIYHQTADFACTLWFELQQLTRQYLILRLPTKIFLHHLTISHNQALEHAEPGESFRHLVTGMLERIGAWAGHRLKLQPKLVVMSLLRLLYFRYIGDLKVDQYNAIKDVLASALLRSKTKQVKQVH